MKRREFVLGACAAGRAVAANQGREFRPGPPLAKPGAGRIVDIHVHTWFQEKSETPRFTEHGLNRARPDGDFQMNATWEQFRHDMSAVDKAVILHVARDTGRAENDRTAAGRKNSSRSARPTPWWMGQWRSSRAG